MSTENANPHGGFDKAAELSFLDKLTKSKATAADRNRIRAGLQPNSDWQITWHALRAAKKVGCASSCTDLFVGLIDVVHTVPTSKQTYFERALVAAIGAAGDDAMKPHVDAILRRALIPEKRFDPDDSDDSDGEFERILSTTSCARQVLADLSSVITQTQAHSAFQKLDDPSAEVRAAALDVTTGAMARFAEPLIPKILECSRDADEVLRATAVNGLERCIGFFWDFRKTKKLGSALQGIAKSCVDHDACKARLLEMRSDPSTEVRQVVRDSLDSLSYPGDDSGGNSAKKAKRAPEEDAEED
jgi:hypothetical protein